MRTDPDPANAALGINTQRTIVFAYTYGPEFADTLEVQGGGRGSVFSNPKFVSARARAFTGNASYSAQKRDDAKCFKARGSCRLCIQRGPR